MYICIDICLREFCCADLSSPQISAMLVGHFTVTNIILRKSRQFSAKLPRTQRGQMSKSRLAKKSLAACASFPAT